MTTTHIMRPAEESGIFRIGGDLPVGRLGFGSMQLPGPGVWGPPRDHDEAIHVLRRANELGRDSDRHRGLMRPLCSRELIHEALYPYPAELVIATKAGFVRTGPNEWHPLGRPESLRQEAEMCLRRLGLDRVDLFQAAALQLGYSS